MKKILVPCDFSSPSIEAFKFAVTIAEQSGGEIIVLHVVELPSVYGGRTILEFEKAYMDDQKAKADKRYQSMKEKYGMNVRKITGFVEFGGTVSCIRDAVSKRKADLVVMGTHGSSGIKEFVVGSNTEKIVRSSTVPVIAVKKSPGVIKEILFPLMPDLKQEDLVTKVKQLQTFFGARLNLLYVNTPENFKRDKDIQTMLSAFVKRYLLKDYAVHICNAFLEEEGITQFVMDHKTDLIAMRTHGRRGIAHFAMGSIAEDLVNHLKAPIWTYKVK